jgi:hypothetical protein
MLFVYFSSSLFLFVYFFCINVVKHNRNEYQKSCILCKCTYFTFSLLNNNLTLVINNIIIITLFYVIFVIIIIIFITIIITQMM